MTEEINGSLSGDSRFKGLHKSSPPHHRILLSYDSVDKHLSLPKTWSFEKFQNEVRKLFPKLKTDFEMIDADFLKLDESRYDELLKSVGETWLLIHTNGEDGSNDQVVLNKPCRELLKYDVHPNALTESGNYHFSSCYQALCEFIDNSVQATNLNKEGRIIKLHFFENWKVACIFDNGSGMSSEGLKAFASYFLSQEDRGLEKGCSQTFGYLDGVISKFGVGATQAGFYLGDTIKVVTKKADSKFVTEVSISKKKLHERAKQNIPVFEDYKWIRNPGDTSTLTKSEECLKELIAAEKNYTQFTYVVIRDVHEKHINYIYQDNGVNLARDLTHVYYFYIHGGFGKLEFDKISLSDFGTSSKLPICISIVLHHRNGKEHVMDLKDVDDDIESLYQQKAKSVFPFCLELNSSENSVGKHVVQGCLLYFPNELGEETLPKLKNQDGDMNQPEPCFECFWQGRLAPLSYVNRLEFCSRPENRYRRQKDMLPDACFNRIRGLLFFNRNTPVSNNKLKILLDTSMDLSDALSNAATSRRNLAQSFRQWLEGCHRNYDKEIIFLDPLAQDKQPNNGDLLCERLKIVTNSGDVVYEPGDIVKLDTRPVAYGKVLHFNQKGKVNEPGTVFFSKLPVDMHGDAVEERPVMRLAGKPDKAVLKKYIAGELVQMPKTIKVFEGGNRINQVSDKLEFVTGEEMKSKTNFWVAIYNGEKEPKNIVDLHHKKLNVKLEITGRNPIVNRNPVSSCYGFKPFYMDRAGVYVVKFTVLIMNEPCGVKKELEIVVKPNVAEIVNLLDNSPYTVPLGESCIAFTLAFNDIYENPTNLFKGGNQYVELTCSSKHLKVVGLKENYQPDEDGILKVSGLSVLPGPKQINLKNDYEFWIYAIGIGDVMFAIKLLTGEPCKVKMTKLSTCDFQNYENFPEIDVKVLDQYNQPSIIRDSEAKLALLCDAFTSPVLKSNLSDGKAKFPTTPIKVEDDLSEPLTQDVRISLIIPEERNKNINLKVIKELLKFQINIHPSLLCKKIKIVKEDVNLETVNGCSSLEAVAGSIIKNLRIIGFTESGEQISVDDMIAQDLHVTTTWAEVDAKNLPCLPDCPVTNITQVNVQNVQCFCKYNGFEIRNEAKLRIAVTAGAAVKWSLQPLTLSVVNGKKNDLSKAVTIITLDKHHNPTLPGENVLPIVTYEHSKKDAVITYSGDVVFKKSAFYFTPASMLSGTAGRVTLNVHDEHGVLTKDSISVQLNSGPPMKILVSCEAFEKESKNPGISFLRMYAGSTIPHPIVCNIADCNGNHTETKTTLKIEWSETSVRKPTTRGTKGDGGVTFPANTLRCNEVVEKARLKIYAIDISTIQPFWIDVEVLPCNRVTKLTATVEGKNYNTCSDFPVIKISHETEDSVPAPNFMNNISLQFKKPSGEYISLPDVYPPLQTSVENNVAAIFKPNPNHPFEESGEWIVSCTYTETRPEIKQIANTVLIGSCKLMVKPGVTVKFCLSIPESVTLYASSTNDVKGRTLIPYCTKATPRKNSMLNSGLVFLTAVDEHGNKTSLNTKVKGRIEAVDDSVLGKDGVLPALENNCTQFNMRDGCIELPDIVLKQKVGNKIGVYHLVFSDSVYKPCKVPFFFSTSEELEKVTEELEPLRNEMTSLGMILKLKQNELAKKRTQANMVFRNVSTLFNEYEPDLPSIDVQITKIRNENREFECREQNLRKATKDPNYPPNSVRQYIKGLVCELTYVSDEKLCRILSWFAQAKLKVAVTQNKEQQRKVYDLGCPAYSENLISGFHKKAGYDPSGLLPIDLPRPPNGFQSAIRFAVNLLEFTPSNAYLRGTLFYSIFSNTIVLADLDHGQTYREHLLKSNHRCPAILTMGGDLIASDGLMDPNRRCPAGLDQLRYTFGELPFTEKTEYKQQQHTLLKLNELHRAFSEVNLVRQEVQQCEIDLKERQKALQPRITELERSLATIREKTERLPDGVRPPPTKKKRI